MHFFAAEKQGSYFEGWSMRHFAFDSQRRHVYYTEREKNNSRSRGNTDAPQRQTESDCWQWKKKFKLTKLVVVSTVHEFRLDDPHLKETDFFSLELHGKTRLLSKDEPPREPLLLRDDNSAAPQVAAETKMRDPFRLCELYDLLRDQFAALRRNQGLRTENSGMSISSQSTSSETTQVRTMQSPRGASAKEHSIVVNIRCRNEEEFWQVWYIMQMVLGFDKLDMRPCCGLPPYDPRNGIAFGHIPMYLWHTFIPLEKSVFYTFIRGDLVGRDHDGQAEVSLPNAYLCITHEMVLVMRKNGTIPRWIHLHNVNTFECNTVAKRPFFALLTDDPSPDILFIPKPPAYGPVAISKFSGVDTVLTVKLILQDTCFASSSIRRAIEFRDVNSASSVRAYFNAKDKIRRFKFAPLCGFDHSFTCLIPKEHLARVWRDVLQEQRSRSLDDIAAIPLEGVGSRPILSKDDIKTVKRQMDVQRAQSHDEIVGMPLDKLLERREKVTASVGATKIPADSLAFSPVQREEEIYQQPGTRYLCPTTALKVRDDASSSNFGPESNVEELVNASFATMGISKPSS